MRSETRPSTRKVKKGGPGVEARGDGYQSRWVEDRSCHQGRRSFLRVFRASVKYFIAPNYESIARGADKGSWLRLPSPPPCEGGGGASDTQFRG